MDVVQERDDKSLDVGDWSKESNHKWSPEIFIQKRYIRFGDVCLFSHAFTHYIQQYLLTTKWIKYILYVYWGLLIYVAIVCVTVNPNNNYFRKYFNRE